MGNSSGEEYIGFNCILSRKVNLKKRLTKRYLLTAYSYAIILE